MTFILDTETIKVINLFETASQINVKDCIIMDDRIYILAREGELKKVGENGYILKSLEKMLKKKIIIFEYSKDVSTFLKNSVKGIREIRIRNEKEKTTIEISVENAFKSLAIGKDGKNIKALRQFLKRNYNIDNLVIK
ncbi:MAG: NusA-like transcription termination signal-binding factor [Candidatus Aenigmarchaeota archaeon]|jgi:NusA-like KH domain protein|nr:NusA-like transcription termination signal-binding factor [Candidatus Aenigmarchaeota archaeon]